MVNNVDYLSSLEKSDHLVLSFNFVCYTVPEFQGEQESRLNFFKGDYVSVREELSSYDWASLLNGKVLQHSCEGFAEINIELM